MMPFLILGEMQPPQGKSVCIAYRQINSAEASSYDDLVKVVFVLLIDKWIAGIRFVSAGQQLLWLHEGGRPMPIRLPCENRHR